jgi:hypothetical protein
MATMPGSEMLSSDDVGSEMCSVVGIGDVGSVNGSGLLFSLDAKTKSDVVIAAVEALLFSSGTCCVDENVLHLWNIGVTVANVVLLGNVHDRTVDRLLLPL